GLLLRSAAYLAAEIPDASRRALLLRSTPYLAAPSADATAVRPGAADCLPPTADRLRLPLRRGRRRRGLPGPVIRRLVLFDQFFHPDGVALAVPVAPYRTRAPARLDHHVREEQVRVDQHRRDVRHVDRLVAPAEPLRRVVHDACGRDRDLRRKQVVSAAPAARPKYVFSGDTTPSKNDQVDDERD